MFLTKLMSDLSSLKSLSNWFTSPLVQEMVSNNLTKKSSLTKEQANGSSYWGYFTIIKALVEFAFHEIDAYIVRLVDIRLNNY